jgi:catechol 2,3-dioxygenase-like lactoylglutathione lyase family enzyme
MTVQELDGSVRFYREVLGSQVMSDAERKGEVADKITGIPGIHTRTVYLSVAPYEHLELFHFYSPKTFLGETPPQPHVRILYCAMTKEHIGGSSHIQGWSEFIVEDEAEPYGGSGRITLQDPDGLFLRIFESRIDERGDRSLSRDKLLYPAIVIADLETSVEFYQEVLGLKVAYQGVYSSVLNGAQDSKDTRFRWALLEAGTGVCLKLVEPLDCEVLPASPWRMETVGFTHVAFAVDDLESYYSNLLEKKVGFFSRPQILGVGPHRGGRCVYLRTPDGITLEFLDSPLTNKALADSDLA